MYVFKVYFYRREGGYEGIPYKIKMLPDYRKTVYFVKCFIDESINLSAARSSGQCTSLGPIAGNCQDLKLITKNGHIKRPFFY